MKNKCTELHALAIACALLATACTEAPVRATPPVSAPVMSTPVFSAPNPVRNDALMVAYACNSHKTIAVTYRSGGSDQTAKAVLEGKVLILTRVDSPLGSPVYVSEPYSLQVANAGDIRQAGMTVFKRQTRKVNGVAQFYDAPLLVDCRPK